MRASRARIICGSVRAVKNTPSHKRPGTAAHAIKLLVLHLALFGTIAAFVILVTEQWLPTSGSYVAMFVTVALSAVAASVVTIQHLKDGQWTSTDDMAERFAGGAQKHDPSQQHAHHDEHKHQHK